MSPSAAASDRSDTGRPTIDWASDEAVAADVAMRSTTRPPRMIVTSSVAWRISSSLCDTNATARCSSTTTARSTENSCSLSAGVSTLVGSSNTMISGSRRRHLMISTRWRWPAVSRDTVARGSTPSP
jgi:hypothetical protein